MLLKAACSSTTLIDNSLFEFTKRPRRSKPDAHSHLLVWTYRERRVGLYATWAFLWVSQRQHHLTDLNSNNKKIIIKNYDRIASNNVNSLHQVRNALWVFQGERRRGTKSIRARLGARKNHMKPFLRTSFLGTRPSCLPSPGRPFFATDDRKPNLWLGLPGSPVISQKSI